MFGRSTCHRSFLLAPGERLGWHGEVHHEQLKILAVAERVERRFRAEGPEIAIACADRLLKQAHRASG